MVFEAIILLWFVSALTSVALTASRIGGQISRFLERLVLLVQMLYVLQHRSDLVHAFLAWSGQNASSLLLFYPALLLMWLLLRVVPGPPLPLIEPIVNTYVQFRPVFRLRRTTAEILRSATVVGAKLCRLDGQIGVVAPGAFADLLVRGTGKAQAQAAAGAGLVGRPFRSRIDRDAGGQCELQDAIQPWGNDLFDTLTGGTIPPNPSDLLGSRRMTALIGQLRDRYDVVLVDVPPLLPFADAAVVVTACDGAILVVRHGKTKTEDVRRAVAEISAVNAPVLGTVLSIAPRHPHTGYGYPYRDRPRREVSGPAAEGPQVTAGQEAEHDPQPSGLSVTNR